MKIGIDLVENYRFESMQNDIKRLSKIFTEREIEYFNKFTEKLTHISGNFCAKEAVVKALKIGFSKGITPLDVEIIHDINGAPYINLNNPLKNFITNYEKIDISISHSKNYSTAICIIYD